MDEHDLVHLRLEDDIAVISINHPPVNAISPGVSEGIMDCLDRIEQGPSVRAIVLCGTGRTFCAGFDIREIGTIAAGDMTQIDLLQQMIMRLEDYPIPTIAAIHGTALGAGLEVALGCHYRIAHQTARLGLPEVKLGLIPGAAGTQRLPRLSGIVRAAELCATGQLIEATEALDDQIIDRVTQSEVVGAAVKLARDIVDTQQGVSRTREISGRLGEPSVIKKELAELRDRVARESPGEFAPAIAIEAVQCAGELSFADGTSREAELFQRCLRSPQSQGLIHVFFGTRTVARIPGIGKETSRRELKQSVVVAGQNDVSSFANSLSKAGLNVTILQTASTQDRSIDSAIGSTADPTCLRDADLVVDLSPTMQAAAQPSRSSIDEHANQNAIIWTARNHNSLGVAVESSERAGYVLGWRNFRFTVGSSVFEFSRDPSTTSETVATSCELAKRMRAAAIVVNGFPHSVGLRMLGRYLQEAKYLADGGIAVERIDGLLKDFGMAAGPFQMIERLGNVEDLIESDTIPTVTGAPLTLADEQVVERTVLAMVNEGANILHERLALRPVDLDILFVRGFGFPAYRGGPMKYADMIGLAQVLDRIREFGSDGNKAWKASPLLEQIVSEGRDLGTYQLA